mmetsp:Transcript_60331/g.161906  ORF Transcript_60331/g.161906 Transcript_60331/m.161906 type:complete len:252 (+) Transcript_60331:167-922(+)
MVKLSPDTDWTICPVLRCNRRPAAASTSLTNSAGSVARRKPPSITRTISCPAGLQINGSPTTPTMTTTSPTWKLWSLARNIWDSPMGCRPCTGVKSTASRNPVSATESPARKSWPGAVTIICGLWDRVVTAVSTRPTKLGKANSRGGILSASKVLSSDQVVGVTSFDPFLTVAECKTCASGVHRGSRQSAVTSRVSFVKAAARASRALLSRTANRSRAFRPSIKVRPLEFTTSGKPPKNLLGTISISPDSS